MPARTRGGAPTIARRGPTRRGRATWLGFGRARRSCSADATSRARRSGPCPGRATSGGRFGLALARSRFTVPDPVSLTAGSRNRAPSGPVSTSTSSASAQVCEKMPSSPHRESPSPSWKNHVRRRAAAFPDSSEPANGDARELLLATTNNQNQPPVAGDCRRSLPPSIGEVVDEHGAHEPPAVVVLATAGDPRRDGCDTCGQLPGLVNNLSAPPARRTPMPPTLPPTPPRYVYAWWAS